MVKEDLSAEEQVSRDARVEEQPAVILAGHVPRRQCEDAKSRISLGV